MNRLGEVIQNSYSQFFILLIASIQSLRSPNAVSRIYPSPLGPKPTPGGTDHIGFIQHLFEESP